MLSGVRILDLTTLLPGPFASLLLADMGADVIKVESPLGDMMREAPPVVRTRSAYFLSVNRNKRSFGVNLKKPAGRDLFLDLVMRSDVVLEGFRPGRADRMGIGPVALRSANPRLIYCAISGYGQTGPDKRRAGHDLTYLARGGVLSLNRRPGDIPVLPPVQIADLAAGTNAALAVCAALYERERTGEGRALDISMLEGVVSWMGLHLAAHGAGERVEPGAMPLTGRFPFYNVFRTADGGHVALAAIEPIFWRDFCRVVDRPDLRKLRTAEGEDRKALFGELEVLFAARTTDEWAALIREHDLSAEVVADLEAVLADEHLAARGALPVLAHPEEGELVQAGPPFRSDGPTVGEVRLPPDQGADTRSILSEVLELDDATVEQLFRDRTVFDETSGTS